VLGERLGRGLLREFATLVTSDTILRWHRHRVARSTIASIFRAEGLPPRGERSTAWSTFLRAHWPLVAADSVVGPGRISICDSDPKWSSAVEGFLNDEGVRIIRTPAYAPNCNAYAERFVRSIKEECVDRVILLGERHLRRVLAEFVARYHAERNHQGLRADRLSCRAPPTGAIRRRHEPVGILSYYYRSAA
jgi:transposase InsO family protein